MPSVGLSLAALLPVARKSCLSTRLDDAYLVNAAIDLHNEKPGLGYRLIADELPEKGITAGKNRVHRLCKLQRIHSLHSVRNGSWKTSRRYG